MTVYQLRGYPSNFYFVKTMEEFHAFVKWCHHNEVKFLHECSSFHGYGFSVNDTNDRALLTLSWL